MEPFVTRIGDVTIERVVPRTGKEPKESIPAPSVSLAKRTIGGSESESDTINVSEDLQIFLKPPAGDGKESCKKQDQGLGKDETESGDSVKSGGDAGKMSTDEDGCDEEDSESEDLRREETEKTDCDVNAKSSVEHLKSNRNEAEEDSEVGGDDSVEKKESDDQERQSETIEESAGGKTDNGCDNAAGEGGEKAESNKRKASLESSTSAGGSQKKKKKRRRRKTRSSEKDALSDGSGDHTASSSSDSSDGEEEQNKPSVERKVSNLRRNIREVMNESQLDEETLAAQRQEMERLRRVQEQQRIIREVQRQIALNKQNTKTQTRVISLLQGNSSILKQIPGTSASSTSSSGGTQVRLPNTVLVKLASGSGSNSSTQTKKVYELLRVQKSAAGRGTSPNTRPTHVRTVPGKTRTPGQVHMMTPSVSIAPVMSSAHSSQQGSDSESDLGDGSDKEVSSSGGTKTLGKPKGKDVVTISSSSDDDDCILLSEPSSGDEGDPVDDPTNSGMHTNDLYNVPDDQGRVLVNVGHPPEEPDIFLAPQIARVIKPHQIGGVRFLYDNVVESVERFNTSTGFGCILAHSMGLGKTLQVVSFCDVFLRHTKARTVLCIMPINTLQNWLAEFNIWLPDKDPQNSPLAVHGEVRPREFPLHVLNDSHKSMTARCKVIQEWNKDGGVLLIGYELYRQLSLRRTHKSKKKRKKVMEVVDVDEEDKNKALLDEIHCALVKPGPDLVICDEGHRIKNSHASISQALKQIRSKRRVVLTGYPLQNNLLEYWCMVDFVRPNYLGTKTEFCNMFERPIQNGQCIDSTPQDIRLMRYRAHVLHSLLEGFVQRRSHSVLQVTLPQKEEYVLLLRMTAFQRKLYDTFMNEVVRTKAVPNPLKAFAVCCKIWNHPDVLYYFLKKRTCGDDVDLDLEETTGASTPLTPRNGAPPAAPKRGRGRTPRSGTGSKRDKKGNGQSGASGRKPAATIIPNNTNLNVGSSGLPMPGGMGGIGHNPHGSMSNMGQSQMQSSLPHQQNQGFNSLPHQNQSYGRDTGSYHDMYHQNIPQGSSTSYSGHGYTGSGYQQGNNNSNFTGVESHGYSDGHSSYGDCNSSNSYYQSTNVRDQSNYNPYYGNTQQVNNENNFQCNSNNSNYWHTNHSSYYQQNVHSDSANNANRGNQYYGSNNSGHYGNTDQSYYLNQQNQNHNYGGQMNGNMYMASSDGYGNNMSHMHGTRNQQSQMDEQSDQRMRNSQSMMSSQMGNVQNVQSHMSSGHCSSNLQNQNLQGQSMQNQNMQGSNLGQNMTSNQSMQGQNIHNQGVSSQNLHSQSMQNQGMQNQVIQGQHLPNQGMQGQNLQNQGMQGQNLQNQGMQGQNLQNQGMQGQNLQNQGMQGQNLQNQGMQGQNLQNQSLHGQTMHSQTMSNQGLQGQSMSNQGMQNLSGQGLQGAKQNVLGTGLSGQNLQSPGMENQNMQSQNLLGASPATTPNANHCGSQMNNVQNSMEKISQMCSSPQNRSSMSHNPQTSPMSSQKMMAGSHAGNGRNSSSAHVDDGQGNCSSLDAQDQLSGGMTNSMSQGRNLPPLMNPMHQSVGDMNQMVGADSMNMQNTSHINQGIGEMQSQMGMSAYHNSGANSEVTNSQQSWHYGHQGIPGDNSNSSCSFNNPMEHTYPNSGRLCDVKPDVSKLSATHSDPLCEMGSMYNRFPSKDGKQENSDQWVSNDMSSDQNMLNTPLKCDPGDSFGETNTDRKLNVKTETSCRSMSPQDSNQSRGLLTSPNKNLSEESSANEKTEVDTKECEQSHLISQCNSPTNKSVFPNVSKIDSKLNETAVDSNSCTDMHNENKEQNMESTAKVEGSIKSPNSEMCDEKNKDVNALKEDSKGNDGDMCKSVKNATEEGGDSNKTSCGENKNVCEGQPNSCPEIPVNVGKLCTKEDPGIPYDWATELLKNYIPGSIENSAKMEVFFCILEESMALGDRMLVFSQSLFTLNLIEDFLQRSNLPGRQEKWSRNWNYYRLDGSTSALEREKLINEYNSNPNIHLFLVSTRAGSLGINLVGANRVVVFDASWNPCHDTQAVCRVYRYGQKKPCFVYRLVMDNCLEKKIYDRQINKQGMADRVVDECNPDAHLSIKEVTNLCWDNEEESEVRDFSKEKHKYIDVVMQKVLDKHSAVLTKEPFQHESLLVDRKEKKLSQAEKRLAKRSYELEKQANINYNRPQYSYYPSSGVCNSGMQTSLQIRAIRTDGTGNNIPKPVASVRPMQAELNSQVDRTLRTTGALNSSRSRWIPADVWQRQGMSAQEMTLPLDVVIPTNSPDRASIVLKAGQRVMVLKSPKGIYMQLENGKIIAIRTAFKVGGTNKGGASQDFKNTLTSNIEKGDLEMKPVDVKKEGSSPNSNRGNIKVNSVLPLKNNSAITIIPKISPASNISRLSGNTNKLSVSKILPTSIKQEPGTRSWGSNSKPGQVKTSDSKLSHARGDNKPYFNLQNQNQRSCDGEEFEDGDSNDQPQSSSSKPFFTPEGEGKGGSNTHSSFSDDGSSGVTNLMLDDKENSNLTEGEALLKSPSPQSYQNSLNRKEDGELCSEASQPSHENSPKDLEREKPFPQKASTGEESQSDSSHMQDNLQTWQSPDKSVSSYEANKSRKGSTSSERDFHNYPTSNALPSQTSSSSPSGHTLPHQPSHSSMHSSTSYQGDYTRPHEEADRHLDTSVNTQQIQQQEYSEEVREANKQDVNIPTSYSHKNICPLPSNSNQSDAVSRGQTHPHFIPEHHKSLMTNDSNSMQVQSSSSNKPRDDGSSTLGGIPVSTAHSYTENTMKSPINYHNALDSATNSYAGYKHDNSSTGGSIMEQNKNVIRPYHEANIPTVTGDLHSDTRGKCDPHKTDTREYDTSQNTKMKMNEVTSKTTAPTQQYLPQPSHAQSNTQVSTDTLTPGKKRQSSKSVTPAPDMSNDCTARYNMDNSHMKSYTSSNSVPDSQHSNQTSQSVSLTSNFPTSSSTTNITSENYQTPLHNPHVGTTDTHSTDYSHVGNLKTLSQTPSDNMYGSSYSQYLGGPTYYGFGQQTTPSMVQFSNPYYGDNQYERQLTSEQGQSKDRNAAHSVGRSDSHPVSSSLSLPSKKETPQLSSGDSRELKHDSKPSLCGREEVRTSGSPASASGSHSNNNSARSTPAINQTPVSSASTDPSPNCNPTLPSALPSVPPTNFNPYTSSATSTTAASLSAHQNPYESMMLNSYTPGTCQYNIPGSGAASTSGPFSTAATNYGSPLRPTAPASGVSPYAAPAAYGNSMSYGAGVSSQYDTDYARASMYSAFHRPEPHHFAPAPTELAPPFLPAVAPPTNPSPFGLSSHHRSPHFPTSPGSTSQNSNYYPQNMYAPSPYPSRPGYTATDTTYGMPYGSAAPTFSPFLNHHLHQHPYPPLQHPGSAPPPGPQSTGASPAP